MIETFQNMPKRRVHHRRITPELKKQILELDVSSGIRFDDFETSKCAYQFMLYHGFLPVTKKQGDGSYVVWRSE